MLPQIRSAIIGHRTVAFEYHTRHGAEVAGHWSYREVDPYALINVGGSWYMPGYCHMREGIRNFRVQRMENLRLLDKQFTRPAAFKLGKRPGGDGVLVTARVLFSPEIASWVRESPSFFSISYEDTPDGLLVTFAVREESDLLQYILGWGRYARVLEPQSLVERLAEEAEAILQNHKRTESLLT
jgi:predicted DNA-binding transcriptional regulator YafY